MFDVSSSRRLFWVDFNQVQMARNSENMTKALLALLHKYQTYNGMHSKLELCC